MALPTNFLVNRGHTLTTVYDEGDVVLLARRTTSPKNVFAIARDIDLEPRPLRIGEDNDGILNEKYPGTMNEILILSHELSTSDLIVLASRGGVSFLGLRLTGNYNQKEQLGCEDVNRMNSKS